MRCRSSAASNESRRPSRKIRLAKTHKNRIVIGCKFEREGARSNCKLSMRLLLEHVHYYDIKIGERVAIRRLVLRVEAENIVERLVATHNAVSGVLEKQCCVRRLTDADERYALKEAKCRAELRDERLIAIAILLRAAASDARLNLRYARLLVAPRNSCFRPKIAAPTCLLRPATASPLRCRVHTQQNRQTLSHRPHGLDTLSARFSLPRRR